MGHPAAFRVPAGQFDDEVQSTGANRRCPLHRMATSGHEELGREERMEPVDNLRVEIRLRSTACDVYSVHESWSTWRKIDRSATGDCPPQ